MTKMCTICGGPRWQPLEVCDACFRSAFPRTLAAKARHPMGLLLSPPANHLRAV